MNDRQRYTVGIAAAVLVHLFAAVMLGLFGVRYLKVPSHGEVLQVSIDAGSGNRGGGGGKKEGGKVPAAKLSEAKIDDIAESVSVETPDEGMNEKVPEERTEPPERGIKRKRWIRQARLFLIQWQEMMEGIHRGTEAAAVEKPGKVTAAVRVTAVAVGPVMVMETEADREPVFLLRRRQ